ncbi:amino acid adenylation domain-containing protein [Solwaraspora sp. WMMA2056]|uniref:amino acid adenylation domain-containing protein n=1 Tax=Solwaraspora sp. WMMA2056 TaxID=3015161 RepID=UPI00259BA84E|nr:non-ribosomal peptide synthetase [Solwaraspora sp. WMMA2056]WJK39429.1 amino acid adenylation domain-containing protein [Solwaraspora sp. WMMA2056]
MELSLPSSAHLPLSPHQRDVWVAASRFPHLPQFNCCIYDRFDGRVDVPALRDALAAAIARNDSFHLRFDEADGTPWQWYEPAAPVVEIVDFTATPDPAAACAAWIADRFDRPFPLHRQRLYGLWILRESESVVYAYVQCHHIVCDAWGLNVLVGQVRDDYAHRVRSGRPAHVDAPSYVQSVLDQQEQIDDVRAGASSFFRSYLRDVEPALFHRRSPAGTRRTAIERFTVDRALIDRIRAGGDSPFAFLTAVIAGYLGRVHRSDEVLVGVSLLNRLTGTERALTGHFANTLPMRVPLGEGRSVRTVVDQIRQDTRQLKRHERYPLGDLLRDLRASGAGHRQLFDVTISYMRWSAPVPVPDASYRTVATNPSHDPDALAVLINELDEVSDVVVELGYGCDVFDEDLPIAQVGRQLTTLLRHALAEPATALAALPLLTGAEIDELVAGHTDPPVPYPHDATLASLFAAAVDRHPDRAAVVDDASGRQLTFADLARSVDALAAELRGRGIGADDRVAVLAARSLELVVAVHAVARAGAAYVPVDPGYPAQRIATLLADSAARIVLTDGSASAADAVARMPAPGSTVVPVTPWLSRAPGAVPAAFPRPTDLAYVIYTSGSTGRPKGTMVEHRSVVNRLHWMQRRYPIGADDVLLQKTPSSFDVSVWELFWWSFTGARLALAPPGSERDPDQLLQVIERCQVTVIHFVPSMLGPLLDLLERAPQRRRQAVTLRLVFASGEALTPERVRQFNRIFHADPPAGRPLPLLVNLYGPTEATVDVSYYDCPTGPQAVDDRVPIGRAIDNIWLSVLDAHGTPQPPGIAGELCVSGVGVARGYLDRPDLTRDRFVADPLRPGERMYRTGDLARWLADGNLEYLGRLDEQVKIRGNRVELGEVRRHLATLPGVRDAVVVDHRSATHGTRLVGYYVADQPIDPTDLRTGLARSLPDFMVPSFFVRIDAVPLTPNGKTDRRALPDPAAGPHGADRPRTPTEQTLAGIWSDVLGVDQVGVWDNYYGVGGDSILMLRLRAEAARHGLALTLGDLVRWPTIAEQAAQADRAAATVAVAGPATASAEAAPPQPFDLVTDRDRARLLHAADAYPISRLSLGLLFHSRERESSAVYHDVFRYTLRLPWDAQALQAAMDALVSRHPALRSSFDLAGYFEPLQIVHHRVAGALTVTDLREVDAETAQRTILAHVEHRRFHRYRFDQPPLYQLHAFPRATAVDLVLSFHHALLDGWSVASLVHELVSDYQHRTGQAVAAPVPAPTVSGAELIRLERAALASPHARAYWQDLLDGAEPTQVEGFRAYQPPTGEQLIVVEQPVPPALRHGVRRLAAELAVPVKSVLFAAHCLMLQLFSGAPEVVTGLVTHGRPEVADGDRVAGLFLNTLPVRVTTSDGAWADTVRQVHLAEQQAHPYRRFPLSEITRLMGGQRLGTAFNYVHPHALAPLVAGPTPVLTGLQVWEETSFTLLLNAILDPADDQLRLRVDCAGTVFTRVQADLYAQTYLRILDRLTRHPQQARDWGFLVAGDDTTDGVTVRRPAGEPTDVVRQFRGQAARTPDAPAIGDGARRWTYRELDEVTGRIAARLRALGVGPDVPVGVAMDRSAELVAVVLGICRSGGAVVPLDVSYPRERIRAVLEIARPVRIVAHRAHRGLLGDGSDPTTLLDIDALIASDGDALIASDGDALFADDGAGPAASPDLDLDLDLESIACILFTSGSAGRPKGVELTHRLWANYVQWQVSVPTGAGAPRTLQFAPLGFDVSFQEIFSTLACGGELRIISEADRRNPSALLRTVDEHQVERVFLPYVALQQFAEAVDALDVVPQALRVIVSSGEQLRITEEIRRLCRRLPGLLLENQYGPTETNLASTWLMSGDPDRFPVLPPIGRAISGAQLHVLDDRLRPVPTGAPGEIYLGGACLSRGYRDQPELTSRAFLPHPDRPGARLYRTGDVAMVLPDGDVVWLGRRDTQVKIRGFRVELAEVEVALLRAAEDQPAVRAVAVVAHRREAGDALLVAFLVGDADVVDVSDLGKRLRVSLPDYMVPAHFVWLPRLPVTPSGKRDDAALRRLPLPTATAGRPAPARDGYERALAELLADLLGLPQVGIHDNFFDLGGTSVAAMRLAVTVEQRYGVHLPIAALVAAPTVAELAVRLRQRSAPVAFDPLVPLRRDGTRPPLFLVHPLGGNVLCYVPLSRHLPADQPVYALQAAGADPGAEPLRSLPELAASYLTAVRRVRPTGPYVFSGWSFGGFVALEMAAQLRRAQPDAAVRVILLDSITPGTPTPDAVADDALLEWFFWELCWFERGATPTEALPGGLPERGDRLDFILRRAVAAGVLPDGSSRGVVERLFGVFQANWQALLDHRPPPYVDPIVLLRASGELPAALRPMHEAAHSRHADPDNGLTDWAGGGLTVVEVPGDHLDLLDEPHVRVLADRLNACLVSDPTPPQPSVEE